MEWVETDKVIRDQEANRTVGAGYLRINSGETVPCRFISRRPYAHDSHWVNRLNKGFVCAKGVPGFAGCICCVAAESDNGIGRGTTRFAMTVISDRRVHAVVSTVGNEQKRAYFPCMKTKETPCDLCNSGNKAQREGKKYLTLATKFVQNLRALDIQLHKSCGSCRGIGDIEVDSHECPSCGEPLSIPKEATKVICAGCKDEVVPIPNYTCSEGCKTPKPRHIGDCWIAVTKTGADQQTNYSFVAGPPKPLDEADAAVEPHDFKVTLRPKNQVEIATALKVKYPWGDAGEQEPWDDKGADKGGAGESVFDE